MKESRLFISAMNIHRGGGRAQLLTLARAANIGPMTICIDQRMSVPEWMSNLDIRQVKPTILERVKAEHWLRKSVRPEDRVICFGNLPPLYRLPCYVAVFLQNRYLIDDISLSQFALRDRLRLIAERLWLSRRLNNVDEFIVQTPTMSRLLQNFTRREATVLPISDNIELYERVNAKGVPSIRKSFDFLYVASGEPHKNHDRLIEAWSILAKEGLYPSLRLTVDCAESPQLCNRLNRAIESDRVDIVNLGKLSPERVLEVYRDAGALIYPSTLESFGLPLIEARQAGLPIVASELDYVRDIVDPEQTFDPTSPVSISRAVKRYMGLPEPDLPLHRAEILLKHVAERSLRSANSHC